MCARLFMILKIVKTKNRHKNLNKKIIALFYVNTKLE